MTASRKALALILALAASSGLALAHKGASGVVETRMDTMESMADQMKQIGEMMRGESQFDSDTATAAARQLSELAGSAPEQFPEGSNPPPSEARDVIWTEWDAFSELSQRLEARSVDLHQAARSASRPADLVEPFRAVGRACSGCHEQFRREDN